LGQLRILFQVHFDHLSRRIQVNRYAYVQNDPMNLIDPLGLDCQVVEAPSPHIQCDVTAPPPGLDILSEAFVLALNRGVRRPALSVAEWDDRNGFPSGIPSDISKLTGPIVGPPPPSDRQLRANCILQALNQAFGASGAQFNEDTNARREAGGHLDVTVQSSGQASAIQQTAAQNSGLFGIRSDATIVTVNGQYALHVNSLVTRGDDATLKAHLDVGNPNRDLWGIAKHVGIDFFKGQLGKKDLDPRCLF
jgi:hypothetical protein